MVTLGEKLRIVRETRGLTQKALADLAGLCRDTISNIEKPHSDPRVSSVIKIFDALKIRSFDELDKF